MSAFILGFLPRFILKKRGLWEVGKEHVERVSIHVGLVFKQSTLQYTTEFLNPDLTTRKLVNADC